MLSAIPSHLDLAVHEKMIWKEFLARCLQHCVHKLIIDSIGVSSATGPVEGSTGIHIFICWGRHFQVRDTDSSWSETDKCKHLKKKAKLESHRFLLFFFYIRITLLSGVVIRGGQLDVISLWLHKDIKWATVLEDQRRAGGWEGDGTISLTNSPQ